MRRCSPSQPPDSGAKPALLTFLPLLRHLSGGVHIRPGSILTRGDLVNDACAAVLAALPSFDPLMGTLAAFVYYRARGAMQDAIRCAEHSRARRRGRFLPLERAAGVAAPDGPTANDDAALFAVLPLRQRRIATEHWLLGRTAADIAADYGRSAAWVFLELRRARSSITCGRA